MNSLTCASPREIFQTYSCDSMWVLGLGLTDKRLSAVKLECHGAILNYHVYISSAQVPLKRVEPFKSLFMAPCKEFIILSLGRVFDLPRIEIK